MTRRSRTLFLAALAPLVSGCLWTPELSGIQREIQRQLPGSRFEREVRFSLGPMSLGLARFVTGFIPADVSPEAREAHTYLQDVRRVQLALYRTVELPTLHTVRLPEALRERIHSQGWHLAVKRQEASELIWVLTREEVGIVRDIYVILLDRQQLVLVRVEGRMDQLLAKALENRAGELPQMLGLNLSLQ